MGADQTTANDTKNDEIMIATHDRNEGLGLSNSVFREPIVDDINAISSKVFKSANN